MDALTLHDVQDLFTYWREHPPVAERALAVLKVGLGVEEKLGPSPAGPAPERPSQEEIAMALARMPWGRS